MHVASRCLLTECFLEKSSLRISLQAFIDSCIFSRFLPAVAARAWESGRSLTTFLIWRPDSRRLPSLETLASVGANGGSGVPAIAGVVVSAFRLTPFFT